MQRLLLITGSLVVLLLAVSSGMAVADDDDLKFKATLTGSAEVPPNATATKGEAEFEVDEARTSIQYKLKVKEAQGILGAAGAHLHCAPSGINGPVVAFLAGVVTGGLNGEVEIEATLSAANITRTDTPCGATIADLAQAMSNGQVYANVHSIAFPGGVVRGQLVAD